MTFGLLSKIIKENNIPDTVRLLSDSGWECDATEMDGIFYNEEECTIVFTQRGDEYEKYYTEPDWPKEKLEYRELGWKRLYFSE